jgi:hypothetical protein
VGELLSGGVIAERTCANIRKELEELRQKIEVAPTLAIITASNQDPTK